MNSITDWFGWVFCDWAFSLFKHHELSAWVIAKAEGKPMTFSLLRPRIATFLYGIGCWFYSRND
tara:strand:- start:357 stop:548 length:192 start_codon:yes stop_codon:yes gene_type:complete